MSETRANSNVNKTNRCTVSKNTIDIQVTADLLQIYEDHCNEIRYINTNDHQRGE